MRSILRRLRKKPLRTVLTLLQIVLGSLAMTLALSFISALPRGRTPTAPSVST